MRSGQIDSRYRSNVAISSTWAAIQSVRHAVEKGLGMQKLVLGVLFTSVNGIFFWLLFSGGSNLFPAVVGLTAIVCNLLVGIRVGYSSAQAYADDVARVNRYLSDQNDQLAASNRELLERVTADATEVEEAANRRQEQESRRARA